MDNPRMRRFEPVPDHYEVWRPNMSLEERIFVGVTVFVFLVAIVATWTWSRP